jgi:hypothetical protein
MFAIVQNAIIQMLIPAGTPFTWDGVEYPANWCNLSTPEEKAAIGMVDVVYGQMPNQTYYWVTQTEPVYNPVTNQVDIGYTATAKDLTSVKTNAISQINNTAYTILLPTDWMVVKAVETSTSVPVVWNTWRQSIRTTAASAVSAVEGAANVDEVAAVMAGITWPPSPDQVASQLAEAPDELDDEMQEIADNVQDLDNEV